MFAELPEWVGDFTVIAVLAGSLIGTWIALGAKFANLVGAIVEVKLDAKLEPMNEQFRSEIHLTEERFTVEIQSVKTRMKQTEVEILDLRARVVALEKEVVK